MRYLLSGLRINVSSSLRLTSNTHGTSPCGTLLSDEIAHLLPAIKELVSRAAFMEFDFDMIGVYSTGLGELHLEFDVDLFQNQHPLARDVFGWLAEHLGLDFRRIPARLRTLELYGTFPHPKVVEIAIHGDGPPVSVFKYLGAPRQSNPLQWGFLT
ncbi:hypothetical protein FRC04_004978 [Tulasnella sp. 424]|nr:hypothetical protein FRC04_004978 [Tulasnella sp. 424]